MRRVHVNNTLVTILFVAYILFSTINVEAGGIAGTVVDADTGSPIVDASVVVSYVSNGTVVATTETDATGYYHVVGLPPSIYIIEIKAEGYHTQSHNVNLSTIEWGEEPYDCSVSLEPLPPREEEPPLLPLLPLVFLFVIIIIGSLLGYSKLRRESLLQNAVRKRIFDYLNENPGKHYRAILDDLGLPMGVLTYHLNRLEKGNYVESRQDGMYKRFYIRGPRNESHFYINDTQERILAVIRGDKGISQSKIAEKLGVSRKVVNYHIKILNQAGLLFLENHGRETTCYLIERNVERLVYER